MSMQPGTLDRNEFVICLTVALIETVATLTPNAKAADEALEILANRLHEASLKMTGGGVAAMILLATSVAIMKTESGSG